jgi:hypothetical protein
VQVHGDTGIVQRGVQRTQGSSIHYVVHRTGEVCEWREQPGRRQDAVVVGVGIRERPQRGYGRQEVSEAQGAEDNQ